MMTRRVHFKKGFTLIELTVAMAVSAIAMSMLVFCIISINSFLQIKQQQLTYLEDVTSFKTTIQTVLENYQTNNFSVVEQANSLPSFSLESESQNYLINFSDNALYNNGQLVKRFENIDTVNFTTKDNLIKCNLEYGENYIYTIILDKRV